MDPDLSKLNFWSGANYMKREDRAVRYIDITTPAFGTSQVQINHGLGFIPDYDVEADLLGDGRIWQGNRPWQNMASNSSDGPQVINWMDTTNLTLRLYNPTGSTITRRVYFVIYKDAS
jgi:hypothetical protein